MQKNIIGLQMLIYNPAGVKIRQDLKFNSVLLCFLMTWL